MLELSPADWQAIDVTFRLCLYTTLILLIIATQPCGNTQVLSP